MSYLDVDHWAIGKVSGDFEVVYRLRLMHFCSIILLYRSWTTKGVRFCRP